MMFSSRLVSQRESRWFPCQRSSVFAEVLIMVSLLGESQGRIRKIAWGVTMGCHGLPMLRPKLHSWVLTNVASFQTLTTQATCPFHHLRSYRSTAHGATARATEDQHRSGRAGRTHQVAAGELRAESASEMLLLVPCQPRDGEFQVTAGGPHFNE